MKLAGAIFDLDGTLLDSMPIWDHIGENYLIMKGITPPNGLRETLKPMSLLQAARYFRQQFYLPDTDGEIMEQINAMIEDHYRHQVPLKPHVLPFLQQLNDAGVKSCIATATDRHLVEAALERLDIAEYFEFILTCTEVGCSKNEPVIFNRALELLHTGIEETVVFEDAFHAIKTAKAAGFFVAGVYDASAAMDTDAIKKMADCYITSFEEWEVE